MSEYIYRRKTISVDDAGDIVYGCRKRQEKIVFTNGCFDILHSGHIDYLRKSRCLGDLLIVGLNSDASVKRLKGETRPVNTAERRSFVLEALDFVDYIVVFEEDTPLKLINFLQPDVYTKGGDYNLKNIIGPGLGADIIEQYGGIVRLISITENISTTSIIKERK